MRPASRDLAFAAAGTLLAAVLLAAAHAAGDGLGASDPWRHIQWARLLRAPVPGALREWPVYTTFAREGADLWALWHRLLVPFTFGDLERGARAAAVFYGALALGALAYALRRLNRPAAFPLFAGALGLAPGLLARASQARPAALTTALLELSALSAVLDSPAAAFLCAWAHAALHISFVLQSVLVAAAVLAYGRRAGRYAGAVAAGAALGVLARSHPGTYVEAALVQGTVPFRLAAEGFRDLGTELYPAPAAALARLALVAAFAVWALARRRTARPAADARFLLVSAAAFAAAALGARRFLDAAGAFLVLAAAAALPAEDPLPRARPARLAVLGALAAALAFETASTSASLSYPYGSAAYKGVAAALRAEVRPGAVVFHDDWRAWGKLFFEDPTHRYVVGCDPSLMLAADARRFRLWRRLSEDGAADPADAAGAFRDFGAEAVVLSRSAEHPRLKRVLDSAPAFFKPLDVGADAGRGLAAYAIVRRR